MLVNLIQHQTTSYAQANILVGANAVVGHPSVEFQVCDSNEGVLHPKHQQQTFP